jgi:hypothetical protein
LAEIRCGFTNLRQYRISYDIEWCEKQAVFALSTFAIEVSIENLRCLLLAQLYYMQKGDAPETTYYRSLAVGVSQSLGLHLPRSPVSHEAAACEDSQRLFWTLYTFDWYDN